MVDRNASSTLGSGLFCSLLTFVCLVTSGRSSTEESFRLLWKELCKQLYYEEEKSKIKSIAKTKTRVLISTYFKTSRLIPRRFVLINRILMYHTCKNMQFGYQSSKAKLVNHESLFSGKQNGFMRGSCRQVRRNGCIRSPCPWWMVYVGYQQGKALQVALSSRPYYCIALWPKSSFPSNGYLTMTLQVFQKCVANGIPIKHFMTKAWGEIMGGH